MLRLNVCTKVNNMILKYFSTILLIFLSSSYAENSTLQLVHVFFRHGSRTPVQTELYPNDPYMELWEKMGIGELTTVNRAQWSIQTYGGRDGTQWKSEPDNQSRTPQHNIIRGDIHEVILTPGVQIVDPIDSFSLFSSVSFSIKCYKTHRQYRNIGKLQSFQLGSMIKERYQHFVSDYFDIEEITVKSSNSNRTIQTAMLVLEGMFSTFNTGSKLDSFLFSEEHEFKHPPIYCPAYFKEFLRYTTSPRYLKYESQYNDLFKIITQRSNKTFNTLFDTFFLYQYAHSLRYINLILPKWIETLYDRLRDAAIEMYLTQANTKRLKRLNGGNVLKDAITTMRNKTKKMVLVSCHDTNIISMLVILNLFKPHVPDYNAALFIELHYDDILEYYVKIFYSSHAYEKPQELFIEDCGYPCRLVMFEKIVQPYLPRNYTGECEANVLLDNDDAYS